MVVKVGGGLLAIPGALGAVCAALAARAREHGVVEATLRGVERVGGEGREAGLGGAHR